VPLRIGDLAYPAELQAVKAVDGEVELTFDLPDTGLRWEALTARVDRPGAGAEPGRPAI
jgi:hypothetical protein